MKNYIFSILLMTTSSVTFAEEMLVINAHPYLDPLWDDANRITAHYRELLGHEHVDEIRPTSLGNLQEELEIRDKTYSHLLVLAHGNERQGNAFIFIGNRGIGMNSTNKLPIKLSKNAKVFFLSCLLFTPSHQSREKVEGVIDFVGIDDGHLFGFLDLATYQLAMPYLETNRPWWSMLISLHPKRIFGHEDIEKRLGVSMFWGQFVSIATSYFVHLAPISKLVHRFPRSVKMFSFFYNALMSWLIYVKNDDRVASDRGLQVQVDNGKIWSAQVCTSPEFLANHFDLPNVPK